MAVRPVSAVVWHAGCSPKRQPALNNEDLFLDFPSEYTLAGIEIGQPGSETESVTIPAATRVYVAAIQRRVRYLTRRTVARPVTLRRFMSLVTGFLCGAFFAGVAYGLLAHDAGQILAMAANLLTR